MSEIKEEVHHKEYREFLESLSGHTLSAATRLTETLSLDASKSFEEFSTALADERARAVNEMHQTALERAHLAQEAGHSREAQLYQRQASAFSELASNRDTMTAREFNALVESRALAGVGRATGVLGTVYTAGDAYEKYSSGDVDGASGALFGALGGVAGWSVGLAGSKALLTAFGIAGGAMVAPLAAAVAASVGLGLISQKLFPGWDSVFDFVTGSSTDKKVDDVQARYDRGQSHASPIILDLDGNGISTLGLEAGVQFDHNGDGFAQATGWVGPEDALLAMDLTGNEEIETGSELFGNASEIEEGVTAMNGFEALAIHDTNGNGRIDPGDEAWDDLRLWQDANGNGVVDEGELLTLDEVGIGSIDLGYSDSTYVDEHGNEHRQIGRFEWADGREGEATDVWFIQDTAITEARERLDVPEDIATLPDLMGYGEVHDLHQALVRPAANAQTFGSNFDRVA